MITSLKQFNGGLVEDKRTKSLIHFSLTKHFDAFTYPHKLVPYRSTVAEEDKTKGITNFLYVPCTIDAVATYRLIGYGQTTSLNGKPTIYTYDIDTSFVGNWTETGAPESTRAGRVSEVFFYYKDYVYMFTNNSGAGQSLCRVHLTDFALTDDWKDFAANAVTTQPVHHPSDDIAYFFHGNTVSRLNDATWAADVLTFPTDCYISAACAYGNYLAIATVTKGNFPRSVVYLWDRDSSLTTLTERIDFGVGKIVHLANLEGKLIAVMNYFIDSIGTILGNGKILIKQASGQFGITINELEVDTSQSSNISLPPIRYVGNDKLYFVTAARLNGDYRNGIWAVDSTGRLTLDFVEEETGNGAYQGIYKTGNMWWIAHSADYSVNRTNDAVAYSYTSIYESLINGGDARIDNRKINLLERVAVMCEPLPSGASIVFKYRKDADLDGSWTTIFIHTTVDSMGHDTNKIETNGNPLPEFSEIQFRIESTGGAEITGFEFDSNPTDKKLL